MTDDPEAKRPASATADDPQALRRRVSLPAPLSPRPRAARAALLSPIAFALAFGAYAQSAPNRLAGISGREDGVIAEGRSAATEGEIAWLEDWLHRNAR